MLCFCINVPAPEPVAIGVSMDPSLVVTVPFFYVLNVATVGHGPITEVADHLWMQYADLQATTRMQMTDSETARKSLYAVFTSTEPVLQPPGERSIQALWAACTESLRNTHFITVIPPGVWDRCQTPRPLPRAPDVSNLNCDKHMPQPIQVNKEGVETLRRLLQPEAQFLSGLCEAPMQMLAHTETLQVRHVAIHDCRRQTTQRESAVNAGLCDQKISYHMQRTHAVTIS